MKNNFDNANRRKKPQDNDRMMEVSIDCVVFGYGVQSLEVMLIEIGAEELQGPGHFREILSILRKTLMKQPIVYCET